MYAQLRQRGVDAELAEIGVLLQPPDGLHRPERYLAHPRWPSRTPVLEPFRPLFRPPLEDAMDRGLVRPEVAGYGLRTPALGVQRDDGKPALAGVGYLPLGREAAHEA